MDYLDYCSSGRRWRARPSDGFDLAIALEFDGPQPRFFATGPASARPMQAGSFTGAVTAGASCNCGVYTVSPHCHGTHTECVGHVTGDRTYLTQMTPAMPRLAALLTVSPTPLAASGEAGPPTAEPDDPVISSAALVTASTRCNAVPWTALVVRTTPNDPEKRYRTYSGPCPAPYFTREAMQWIVAHEVLSLVVDLPSLDRADDGGQLLAHRTYWGLAAGSTTTGAATRGAALVTELAYVPDAAGDGCYLLDLQVPAFAADAAPSRPLLYRVTEVLP